MSGERTLAAQAFDERVLRAASGFAALGLKPGDCAALLLRNDFAFMEASLAAVRLGAYAVPINWHFKADEVAYILADCGAKVLVAHADLLAGVAHAIPASVPVLVVETPPEILSSYGIGPERGLPLAGAEHWETWLARYGPWQGAPLSQPASMIYTSGTTGRPKGVRRQPADARAGFARIALPRARLRAETGRPHHGAGAALSLGAQRVRAARRARRQPDRADAALRSRGVPGDGGAAPHRGHVHGAHHVRAAAEAPRRCARPLRPLFAEVRHARGGALPAGGEAGA